MICAKDAQFQKELKRWMNLKANITFLVLIVRVMTAHIYTVAQDNAQNGGVSYAIHYRQIANDH